MLGTSEREFGPFRLCSLQYFAFRQLMVSDILSDLLGDLGLSHQRCQREEVADILLDQYGLRGELDRLATEKDDSFRVRSTSGEYFILKIANPRELRPEIAAQVALLEHLTQADLPTPRVVPNLQSDHLPTVVDRAGQTRLLRLMTYLSGTPLDSVDCDARERGLVGQTLAELRLALADFTHEGLDRFVAWDVMHLLTLAPLLDFIGDYEHRAMLRAGLSRFEAVADRVQSLPRQTVHNDFSKSNIIVDRDVRDFVTGVIDFGDTVHTAIAIDVSTALLNQLPRSLSQGRDTDLFADGRDLLGGYLTRAPLGDEELTLLPHLVMGRVIARALITTYRASLIPENATYILRNTEPGWAQLDWMLAREPQTIEHLLARS